MKLTLLFFLGGVVFLQSGCALPPTIDEQSRDTAQQKQVEKRSDEFARSLKP